MRIKLRSGWTLAGLLLILPSTLFAGDSVSAVAAINHAQQQITAYLDKLADLHCTESVVQEKLNPSGGVEATQRAKYDYLIMMSGSGDEFQLNESRVEAANGHDKQAQLPMLVTNGVASVLLVFHPYYRDGFNFEAGNEEVVSGRPAIPVHFSHIAGRRTPAALALRGRDYPLELQGTAWLDSQSGEILKVDAELLNDMSDLGLRSLHIHVDYKSGEPSKELGLLTLPALAVVDVATPRQRWRNTHTFNNYRGFSTDAEQDPNVKVHSANANPDGTTDPGTSPDIKKENK